MPFVFLTAEGRHRWDAGARANIAWEIAELSKQQGAIEKVRSTIRAIVADR